MITCGAVAVKTCKIKKSWLTTIKKTPKSWFWCIWNHVLLLWQAGRHHHGSLDQHSDPRPPLPPSKRPPPSHSSHVRLFPPVGHFCLHPRLTGCLTSAANQVEYEAASAQQLIDQNTKEDFFCLIHTQASNQIHKIIFKSYQKESKHLKCYVFSLDLPINESFYFYL